MLGVETSCARSDAEMVFFSLVATCNSLTDDEAEGLTVRREDQDNLQIPSHKSSLDVVL